MTLARRLLPPLFMMPIAATAAGGETLGRLFFTPEQRALLEAHERKEGMAPGDMLVVDGVVSRSDGKTTVWINGRPQHESAADGGMRAVASVQRPGHAAIVADRAAPVSLRVGETFDRRTGRRKDLVAAGAVRVHADHGQAPR